MRSLYPYDGQRDVDLSFAENVVIIAHPAKDPSGEWWYGTTVKSGEKGWFPHSFVSELGRECPFHPIPISEQFGSRDSREILHGCFEKERTGDPALSGYAFSSASAGFACACEASANVTGGIRSEHCLSVGDHWTYSPLEAGNTVWRS